MLVGEVAPKANEEIEKAILYCLLTDQKKVKLHKATILADDFYMIRHQLIYKVIKWLDDTNQDVDIITIGTTLEKKGKLIDAGGRSYLVDIASLHAVTSSIKTYIKELKKLSKLRKEKTLCQKLESAIDNENEDDIRNLKNDFVKIDTSFLENKPKDLVEVLEEWKVDYDNPKSKIPTGLIKLDGILNGGFAKGTLTSLAGASATGKSILCLQFALEAAKNDYKVLYFNLEMSVNQFAPRVISSVLGVRPYEVNMRTMKYDDKVRKEYDVLSAISIKTVFDYVSTDEIYSQGYLMAMETGLDFIVVDYIAMLTDKVGRSELEKEKELVLRLKNIAKRLSVPVLTPIALNKQASKIKDKEVDMEDMYGSVYQAYTVDNALTLVRNKFEKEGKLYVSKQRDGGVGNVDIMFDENKLLFNQVDKIHIYDDK